MRQVDRPIMHSLEAFSDVLGLFVEARGLVVHTPGHWTARILSPSDANIIFLRFAMIFIQITWSSLQIARNSYKIYEGILTKNNGFLNYLGFLKHFTELLTTCLDSPRYLIDFLTNCYGFHCKLQGVLFEISRTIYPMQ